MIKDLLLVATGSFIGGGLRFITSKWIQNIFTISLPVGTMFVNVLGCFIIGFLSGLSFSGAIMTPNTKLLLTTGFCGGFTTFSTYMNDSSSLIKDGNYTYFFVYLFGSILLGMIAVLLGHQFSKFF